MKIFTVLAAVMLCLIATAQKGVAQDSLRSLDKVIKVKAKPADVWRAWTTREGMREFMGIDSNIELRFGGRYELLFSNEPPIGAQGSEGCQILSFVPEKMLSFSWNAPPSMPTMRNHRTFVVITLTAVGSETEVSLHQGGWGRGPDWDKNYAYFDNAWGMVLGALQSRFENGPVASANPAPAKSPARDETALRTIEQMIGGVWRGEVRGPEGPIKVEFKYRRNYDGKGVIGEGVVGKGTKTPMYIETRFGWDPVAKAVYYFDTHDSETVYFGHVNLDHGDLVFTFSPAGMLPRIFASRGRLVDKDTYQAIITDAEGKEMVGLKLKRSK